MKKTRRNKVKKIVELIKNNKSFLITAHMNLEGDALGSELALYLLLKKLNKKAVIYNHDLTPEIYNFFPKHKIIKNKVNQDKFDLAFVLDCSDTHRAGKVKDKLIDVGLIVNVDHHISNTYFGDINWVEPKTGSACEMVYYLAKDLNLIDDDIAFCLYTGIFTDTGNFTYANTSSDTHRVIADLMRFNIRPDKIYKNTRSLCTLDDLKFVGKHISQLKFTPDKRICWALISEWQEKNYDLTEVIFSIMRFLKDPEVLILFKKETSKKTRVNFRSRLDADVNRIAKFFGGGGHQRASGATLAENIKDAENKVVSFVSKHINGKRKSKDE